MNTITYSFTLDLNATQSQIAIPVTLGDTARTWLISFRDGSSTYKISDGCLAKMEIMRPTGTHIEEFCAIEKNSTVRYSFLQNPNTAAVEGFHECAVVLYDEEGNIISSPCFSMIVSPRVINSDNIKLSNENKLIVDSIITEEISRRNAETERSTAEASRIVSEAQRTLNEAARQSADSERSLAEENRNKRFETLQKEINTAAATLVSPTVTLTPTENGHQVKITDNKGEHMFSLVNGKDGAQGIQGPSGKTAYQYAHEMGYTGTEENYAEDMNPTTLKNQLNNYLVMELAKRGQLEPMPAQTLEDMTDTSKMYVLLDKSSQNYGFIYAYMYSEFVEGSGYTNLANKTSSNWLTGYRTSSSGLTTDGGSPYEVTNFLGDGITPVGDKTVYYKNCTMSNQRLVFYDTNKEQVYAIYPTSFSEKEGFDGIATEGHLFIDKNKSETLYTTAVYIRLCLNVGSTAPIITLDEEITEGVVVKDYHWANTGLAFVPADYEDRINDIEKTTNKNTVAITNIKDLNKTFNERLNSLESSADIEIPEYWNEHLNERISKIKALQDEGGKNCFSFIVISDIHYEQNLGKLAPTLAKKIADECDIKYVLILGDCGTRNGILKDLAYIDNEWDEIETMISPIRDRLLITDGNHDGSYGVTDGDGDGIIDDIHGTGNSAFNYSPQKKYNRIKRKVSLIDGVTFDESGCGYYADDKTSKVRYIVLSTHNNKYEKKSDGSSKYSNMKNFRYGQSQFDLVIKALTTLNEGWRVLLASHVPLDRSGELLPWGATEVDDNRLISGEIECWLMADVLNAFVNRTTYKGNFMGTQNGFDAVSVSVDFTNAKGSMIGYFGGHVHIDGAWNNTYTWEGRLKQCDFWTITTRCDGHTENNSTLYTEKQSGTSTEQSFDVFTVTDNMIYATKIGAGSDREISYR